MIYDNRFEFEKVELPQVWLNLVGRGSKWRAGVIYEKGTGKSVKGKSPEGKMGKSPEGKMGKSTKGKK